MKKENKQKNPSKILKEPTVPYIKKESISQEYIIPSELVLTAYDTAKKSIKEGKFYTQEQIVNLIDNEMGWK